jgi:hypothetical protein
LNNIEGNPLFTIVKFIQNNKYDPRDIKSTPLISRTLGKILMPDKQYKVLEFPIHCNTFWACRIISETDKAHKGILLGEPLFPVTSTTLLPGFFTVECRKHWVFLNLKWDTPIKPYIVPKTIKETFLQSSEGYSVVIVPYNEDQIVKFKKLS